MRNRKIISALFLVAITFTSCKYGRFVVYNFADIKDYKKFPAVAVEKGDYTFSYATGPDSLDEKINSIKITNSKGKKFLLDEYLDEETKTVAFMVIRNDSVLYDRYFEKYHDESIVTSFSVAKSFVSALVGIAIQEGFIKSVQEPITNYLPELAEANEKFSAITIENALNMRTGIKFNESSYANPFSEIAALYYGRNHFKLLKNSKFQGEPGSEYEYQSINTEILGLIVESATGKQLAAYFEEKLWQPLGMEYSGSWNIDSKKHQAPKAYCCINGVAKDFAKFGSLYLKDGYWNGSSIVNQDWVRKSTTFTPQNDGYQYQWYCDPEILREDGKTKYFEDSLSATKAVPELAEFWVQKSSRYSGKWYVTMPNSSFMAIGILGQLIYVDRSKNLVMVRFGKKNDSNYSYIFRSIGSVL
ncbi:MAG: serine hydrolase [Bacteroidota bacterium]